MNNKKIKNDLNHQAIGAIRYIGLKAIQEAKGGHVGMTISAAPITYTLFTKFIKLNPRDGKWINRDRFVLSGGHGSMSLYPIFYFSHLLTLDDIKKFKTEDSKTPGHSIMLVGRTETGAPIYSYSSGRSLKEDMHN